MCSLPDLPDDYFYHTQSGLVTCGGLSGDTPKSCLTFSGGQWITSHTLLQQRAFHSSWFSKHGILLMGGSVSLTTTEMLSADGQSTPGFTLKYLLHSACTIQFDDLVIVTGGQKVSVYNISGWVEDLPDLVQGRSDHGCGHFINNDNKMVDFLLFIKKRK